MKDSLREYFASVIPFLKMNYFLNQIGLSNSAFSRFMKGSEWNYEISEERLLKLRWCIEETLQKIA